MADGLSSLIQHLSEFRSALTPTDQVLFDDILQPLLKKATASDESDNDLPIETVLLALLIQEHRENVRLREMIVSLASSPD
jgi:hypothetical protein